MVEKRKNIVFIGMPGCSKTTIAELISKKLNMRLYDLDLYVEEKEGKTIPAIFDKYGEKYFRRLEHKAVQEVSKYINVVVSTGGGVIKNAENIRLLKKNGIIIFINRSIEDIMSDIEIEGRPLLKDGKHKLYELYNERISLYKKYCDYEIINDNRIECVVKKVLEIVNYPIFEIREKDAHCQQPNFY